MELTLKMAQELEPVGVPVKVAVEFEMVAGELESVD